MDVLVIVSLINTLWLQNTHEFVELSQVCLHIPKLIYCDL